MTRAAASLAVLILATSFGLSGCGDANDGKAVQAAKGGEVLPRSVGDDMLPYDTVRSESQPEAPQGAETAAAAPARRTDASAAAADDDEGADDSGADAPAVTSAEE